LNPLAIAEFIDLSKRTSFVDAPGRGREQVEHLRRETIGF
jgi:hypothetical protein